MQDNTMWWRGGVIYQIYPRSFLDSRGDGVGDLNGITEKLDYVASLNVDGIWLSPFFTSPMLDFGYDVSDYRDVDPMFGTLDDFKALLAKAHSLGLKVMIDQVISHTSDQHPWFKESRQDRTNPKADWFVWADPKPDGTPPNNWLSIFGGPALDLRLPPPAVLPAQLPDQPAGRQFPQPGSASGTAGQHALLARSGCRWVPSGHGQFLLPRCRAAGQPAGAQRRSQNPGAPEANPYTGSATSTTSAARRTRASCRTCAP